MQYVQRASGAERIQLAQVPKLILNIENLHGAPQLPQDAFALFHTPS